ncbi:MAG: Gfo/Idh/MocA family oxidoreductase [Flavobacteriales bacterium]|nr:Gfo/Idh/MocA family oxidoreductase [Flavobacteriales bacterium]
MKILIYGFGRMGLTHFSILNGLYPKLKFYIVEPNKIFRKIVEKNIKAKFYKDDSNLKEAFDLTLITTPPSIHLMLLKNSINRGDKKIFIEKPFGGHTNINYDLSANKIYIGYVLRFNPCIQWVKKHINPEEINSIHGQYLSNTIEKKPSGWRNGPFSGVLNEMGSHVIDLIQYITEANEMDVTSSIKESVVSDVDDIVDATLKTKNGVSVSMYFNWVKKDVRKPVFSIEIEKKDGLKYFVDQQQIKEYDKNGVLINRLSVADLAEAVPYYLRGIDFTKQMTDLMDEGSIMANINDAIGVNMLMNKILSYENYPRR